MPATLDEVKHIVEQAFEDPVESRLEEAGHRIMGTIVSREFAGMDQGARNRLVTERGRDVLGLRGLNVGILVPLAPGEDG
jgi:hypothetical protein